MSLFLQTKYLKPCRITLSSCLSTDGKPHALCYSSQDDANIPEMLSEVIKSEIYREDYEMVTKSMMFKHVPYAEAIRAENNRRKWSF